MFAEKLRVEHFNSKRDCQQGRRTRQKTPIVNMPFAMKYMHTCADTIDTRRAGPQESNPRASLGLWKGWGRRAMRVAAPLNYQAAESLLAPSEVLVERRRRRRVHARADLSPETTFEVQPSPAHLCDHPMGHVSFKQGASVRSLPLSLSSARWGIEVAAAGSNNREGRTRSSCDFDSLKRTLGTKSSTSFPRNVSGGVSGLKKDQGWRDGTARMPRRRLRSSKAGTTRA